MGHIDKLPTEVLEFILSLISPYQDLHNCLSVSKKWKKCVLSVVKTKRRNFQKAITDFNVSWETIAPMTNGSIITKRYSHAAVIHENSMYVFGGCTSSLTTFNDLWRLDLTNRRWYRHLTLGNYPSPKACCTMTCYKDSLILFGGWTHPASYPLHQTWHFFNELHVYDILGNRWTCIDGNDSPPPMAGHSASIHGDHMVVFGGLQREIDAVHSSKSNDVWKLNLDSWIWKKQEIGGAKPSERYGQSQVVLDENSILIIGGTGGASIYYSDMWLLKTIGSTWKWIEVEVRNALDAPTHSWCNPVCKVGDNVIVLSRGRQNNAPPLMYFSKKLWTPQQNPERNVENKVKKVDLDENVNGKWGTFNNRRHNEPQPGTSQSKSSNIREKKFMNNLQRNMNMAAFNSHENTLQDEKRNKRLQNLQRVEEKYKILPKNCWESSATPSPKKKKKNVSGMYVLDISHALDEKPYVSWLPLKNDGIFSQGPEETILYSLVAGKCELIMFGGVQKDDGSFACNNTSWNNQVTNLLHFITAPEYII